jgi:predicted TIM-barrel fold metal-dependent hydrolase
VDEPLIIVSSDGHTGGPPELYTDYIEERFRPELEGLKAENDLWVETTQSAGGWCNMRPADVLDVIDERDAIRTDGELGAWDMDRRIKELDDEGVTCELLLSGHQCSTMPFFAVVNLEHPADLRMAGTRAYHRWLADCMEDAGGRLKGVAEPGPCLDMDDTVKELKWADEHHFRGVLAPGMVADDALPPLYDAHFDPFWQTCADRGLVVVVHAGWGGSQGMFQKFLAMRKEMMGAGEDDMFDPEKVREMLDSAPDSPIFLDQGPRRIMWQLMLGGVFDRHPDLQLMFTEVRADWIPATVAHLDRKFAEGGTPLKKKPSEYYASNCSAAPSSPHKAEIDMRNELGVDRLLFGMDYPHPEGTWPNTWDWIRDVFAGVAEDEVRKIMGENAIKIFGLDREYLASVADKIGPKPSEVLNGSTVDPEKIKSFNQRCGYSRPAEEVDVSQIDSAFSQDLVGVSGR